TGGDEWRTVEGEELDRTGLWVLTLIQGVVATLLLVAASQIQRRPFVWALLVAALQTLNVGLGVLLGQPNVIAIVLAFVYWSGVAAVAPVARLIEEHPDLVAAKRFRGELKKRDGTVRERHRTQRNWRSVGIVVGVIVAVLGATWFGLRWSKRIPSVDPTLERFAADWRSGGVERAAGHFPPEKRDDAAESAGWGADVRGWAERTPPLGGEIQRDEVSETRVDVVHAFDGGEVRSRWRFDQEERAWHVHALELPLGDFDQRLIETWNEGDLDRVAAFFKSPESARGSLSRLVDRRGWERLPPIADPRIERTSKDRVEIHFDSAEGPVRLLLTRRAVRWTLKSIKPPRRS
ncbi:MAG: Yip1 family protein, partial [Planctomycetota bacterium]